MKLTYANIITVSRLFLAPIFLSLLIAGTPLTVTIAVITFGLAAITDWADGYFARRYGEVSEQGAYLDPLADKVLTTSAFMAFFLIGIMPLWMVIVIVVRDFGTTVLRNIGTAKGVEVVTTKIAKIKTGLQLIVIICVLMLYWLATIDPGFGITSKYLDTNTSVFSLLYSKTVWWLLLLLTLWTLFTGLDYIIRYRHLFSRSTNV